MKLSKKQIEQVNWLSKCTRGRPGLRGTWTINQETGLVDVEGNFACSDQGLEGFKGVRFGAITGNFNCSNNSLTTLEGAPQKVGGDFDCSYNPVSESTLESIWSIMRDKKVPYLIALGIYGKEVKGAIDSSLLAEDISEETIKGASLLARNLS